MFAVRAVKSTASSRYTWRCVAARVDDDDDDDEEEEEAAAALPDPVVAEQPGRETAAPLVSRVYVWPKPPAPGGRGAGGRVALWWGGGGRMDDDVDALLRLFWVV